jgi:hypothetical protein
MTENKSQQDPALDLLDTIDPLDPDRLEIEQTVGDGLIVRHPDFGEHSQVRIRPCFPLSRPERFLFFKTEDGEELGLLEDLRCLPEESREALRRELDKQHFIPVIHRVDAIYREFKIPIWEVETDRGHRRLELKSSRDAYHVGEGKVYIRDSEGNPYLIPDYRDLDPASRDLVRLHV